MVTELLVQRRLPIHDITYLDSDFHVTHRVESCSIQLSSVVQSCNDVDLSALKRPYANSLLHGNCLQLRYRNKYTGFSAQNRIR